MYSSSSKVYLRAVFLFWVRQQQQVSREVSVFVTFTPGLPSSSWLALYLFCDTGFFVSVKFFQQMTSCSIILVFNTSSCCLTSNLLWHSFTFCCFFCCCFSLLLSLREKRKKRLQRCCSWPWSDPTCKSKALVKFYKPKLVWCSFQTGPPTSNNFKTKAEEIFLIICFIDCNLNL